MVLGKLKAPFLKVLSPLSGLLVRTGVDPNLLTLFGLVVSSLAALLFGKGMIRLGGFIMLVAGLFDTIDGEVARRSNRVSKFGAFLDSTLDRYSEILVYLGIGLHFVRNGYNTATIFLFFALTGSLMVSYTRARAEGIGESCQAGLMQRTERVVVVAVGALIGTDALVGAIAIVAVLSNFTVLQRISYVRRSIAHHEMDQTTRPDQKVRNTFRKQELSDE